MKFLQAALAALFLLIVLAAASGFLFPPAPPYSPSVPSPFPSTTPIIVVVATPAPVPSATPMPSPTSIAPVILPPLPLPAPSPVSLDIYFIDVGQGDSTLLVARNGSGNYSLLVDGGDSRHGENLTRFVANLTLVLDYVVSTHPDADHIGGLDSVIRAMPPRVFLSNGDMKDTKVFAELDNATKLAGATIIARQGHSFELAKGVVAEVLSPTEAFFNDASDTNDRSLVLKVSVGSFCIILPGDAEGGAEKSVLSNSSLGISCPVLKAGHHGSKSSSSAAWLSAIRPEVVVVSSGLLNRYGHPHLEALARFAAVNATVFRTDERGTIALYTNGSGYSVN